VIRRWPDRGLGVGLAHQRRGHVTRAVLDVETARDLDLLHLLARRHGDADDAFDKLVFVLGGLDEIEPDGGVGNGLLSGRHRNAVKARTMRDIDRQHKLSPYDTSP
jgi:hypothetical protein